MAHLVDGLGVGDGVGVFDDRDRLAGEDRLVDAEGGGHDVEEAKIGRDLVTH